MKEFFNSKKKVMIRLNYNNLDQETQERLLQQSKKEVEQKYGNQLLKYATQNQKNYDALLEEEAIRNLYNLKFIFTV